MTNLAFSPSAVVGNMTWHRSGEVTATFLMPESNLNFPRASAKLSAFRAHANIYALLPSTWSHAATNRQVPITSVVQRMMACLPAGADLNDYPAWRDEINETIAWLQAWDQPPVEKWSVLHVRLPMRAAKGAWMQYLITAVTDRPAPAPPADVIANARRHMNRIYKMIRSHQPGAVPAQESDIRWNHSLGTTFGSWEIPYTNNDFAPHTNGTDDEVDTLLPIGAARLLNKRTDTDHLHWLAPVVQDIPGARPSGQQHVYQGVLVVSGQARAWIYPENALGPQLDALPYAVRYLATATPEAGPKARAKIKRIYKELGFQDTETDGSTTPSPDTEIARADAEVELAELVDHGVSLPTLILILVGAPSREILNDQIKEITDQLDPGATKLQRLHGRNLLNAWSLFNGSLPADKALLVYNRSLRAPAVAGLGIFHGNTLGDPRGRLMGTTGAEGARRGLVFHDPSYGLRAAEGGTGHNSVNTGGMGAGKTMQLKISGYMVTALGHRMLAVDRSEDEEWTRAVHMYPDDAKIQVIKPTSTTNVIDPLRVFTTNLPADKERRDHLIGLAESATVGYLALRLKLESETHHKALIIQKAILDLLDMIEVGPLQPSMPNLRRMLRWQAGANDAEDPRPTNPDGSPIAVFQELTTEKDKGAANEIALAMEIESRTGIARNALYGTGTPVDLNGDVVILSTKGLDPTSEQGMGLYYLMATLALAFMHADPSRFSLILLPEMAALLATLWGNTMHDTLLRQTRRAFAALASDSQLGAEYEDRDALYGERTTGRANDDESAITALKLCGIPEPTEDIVSWLTDAPAGAKLMRDIRGRIGVMMTREPVHPLRRLAFSTDIDSRLAFEQYLRDIAALDADDAAVAVDLSKEGANA